jgi:threonine dehydrogenase-like Zn-dependent dehydrogenase
MPSPPGALFVDDPERVQVFVVDKEKDRLDLAGKIGATPVDFSQGDTVEQVLDASGGRGADCGVEAVGHQAHDPSGDVYTDPDVPPIPPHSTFEQMKDAAGALLKGDNSRWGILREGAKTKIQEFLPHND